MSTHVLYLYGREDQRPLITDSLRHHGYEVTELGAGPYAFARVAELAADVAVLDMARPDAWELIEQIRANPVPSELPLLVICINLAWADGEPGLDRALELGADLYMPPSPLHGEAPECVRRLLETMSRTEVGRVVFLPGRQDLATKISAPFHAAGFEVIELAEDTAKVEDVVRARPDLVVIDHTRRDAWEMTAGLRAEPILSPVTVILIAESRAVVTDPANFNRARAFGNVVMMNARRIGRRGLVDSARYYMPDRAHQTP